MLSLTVIVHDVHTCRSEGQRGILGKVSHFSQGSSEVLCHLQNIIVIDGDIETLPRIGGGEREAH